MAGEINITILLNGAREAAQRVQEFNKTILNGGAALQQWAGIAAAAFGAGAINRFIAAAGEAERAVRQLEAALQARGDQSADYRDALLAQATALETLTAVQDETVLGVQRVLIGFGLAREQVLELTPRVLDLAAALGTDAGTAARQIALTLEGNKDALGRYGIALDETATKEERLAQLAAQLQTKFGGQAEAAATAMDHAKVATANFGESLGRVIRIPLNAFLGGINDSIERVTKRTEELKDSLGPLPALLEAAGKTIGANLGWYVLLAAALVALPAVIKLVMLALNPLRALFVLMAGESIVSFVRSVNLASTAMDVATQRSQGLLKGLWGYVTAGHAAGNTLMTVQRSLGLIGLVVGAGWAGWQIGRWLSNLEINGRTVEDRLVGILDKLNRIGQRTFLGRDLDAEERQLDIQQRAQLRGTLQREKFVFPMAPGLAPQSLNKLFEAGKIEQLQRLVRLARQEAELSLKLGDDPQAKARALSYQRMAEALETLVAAKQRALAPVPEDSTPPSEMVAQLQARLQYQDSVLDQDLEARRVSLDEYLEKRRVNIATSFDAESRLLNDQLAVQERRAAEGNQDAVAQAEKLKTDIVKVGLAKQAALNQLEADGAQKRLQEQAAASDREIQLLELSGQQRRAAEEKIIQDALKLQRDGGAPTQVQQFIRLSQVQLDVADTKEALATAEERYQRALTETNNLVESGSISQSEALRRNGQAAGEYRREIDRLIPPLLQFRLALLAADPQANTKDIDELITRLRALDGELRRVERPRSFLASVRNGVRDLFEEWGNLNERVTEFVTSGLRSVTQTAGQVMADMITGVSRGTQAWRQLGATILQTLLTMVTEYVAAKTAMMVVDSIFHAQSQAQAAQTATVAGVAGVAKAGEQGGIWGVIAYAAVFAAVIGAVLALIAAATGGFARGGIITDGTGPTADDVPVRVSRGEAIIPAREVAKRPGFFQKIIAGTASAVDYVHAAGADLAAFATGFAPDLPELAVAGLTAPAAGATPARGGGFSPAELGAAIRDAVRDQLQVHVTAFLPTTDRDIARMLKSSAGQRALAGTLRKQKQATLRDARRRAL